MERKCIQVTPSSEPINPQDIVGQISSLHKLVRDVQKSHSFLPFGKGNDHPTFSVYLSTEGTGESVKFYFTTDQDYMDTLRNKVRTAWPNSFDVDIVTVDFVKRVTRPELFNVEAFQKKYANQELYANSPSDGSRSDLSEGNPDRTINRDEMYESSGEASDEMTQADSETAQTTDSTLGSEELGIAEPSEQTEKQDQVDAIVGQSGEEKKLSPDEINEYDRLEELDTELLEQVQLPKESEAGKLTASVDGPTWTPEGKIAARPSLEHCEPVVVKWYGKGDRRKDWMTPIKMFSKVADPNRSQTDSSGHTTEGRAPLASLVEEMAQSDIPMLYQVTFERIEDWSKQRDSRKDDLHHGRDTVGQKVLHEIGEIVHGTNQERRREKRRDPLDSPGEGGERTETPTTGDISRRRDLIDNKVPSRTFRVNIRAVSVPAGDKSVDDVKKKMQALSNSLDHLDGYFYDIESEILTDGGGLVREKNKATEEFHDIINQQIQTGSGKKRPDIILNADELSNFVAVPSSRNLTIEGIRGTRAKARTRDPLPKPDPDIMDRFYQPGMRIGYAIDKDEGADEKPTHVPPSLLPAHYGRFATTGGGKSKALINDILSLYENTAGPTILIDPKGDGMPENYLKTHYERFGEEDFTDGNIIHFPIPDVLPGFSFFDIKPSLEHGQRREDAIKNLSNHYEELLKLVMGEKRYRESKVAPIIIPALIKSLFDEQYVEPTIDKDGDESTPDESHPLVSEHIPDRESTDIFAHRHLEEIAEYLYRYGDNDDDGESQGGIPDVSDERTKAALRRLAQGSDDDFQIVMKAVFNRLNFIAEEIHLRQIFDNMERKFDFRDHLNDDKVILFDLGELRPDATLIMAGLILTNLWDALKETDQTKCAEGHDTIEECHEKAERNIHPGNTPPCHRDWDEFGDPQMGLGDKKEHVVNLIIDEAPSVAVSDMMDKMLEQGRGFNLSVGLSMQFPQQMEDASDSASNRTYRNVLNNVGSLMIGQIRLDKQIANAISHEEVDAEEFKNRIGSLPRGEWIAQLPSSQFGETGPKPFSLEPLPIPAGHPKSQYPLNEKYERRFNHLLHNEVQPKIAQEYGIERDDDEGSVSPNQRDKSVSASGLNTSDTSNASTNPSENTNGNTPTDRGDTTDQSQSAVDTTPAEGVTSGGAGSGGSQAKIGSADYGETSIGDVNAASSDLHGSSNGDSAVDIPGGGGDVTNEESSTTDSTNQIADTTPKTNGGGAATQKAATDRIETSYQQRISSDDINHREEITHHTIPNHLSLTESGMIQCLVCNQHYGKAQLDSAIQCCVDNLIQARSEYGSVSNLSDVRERSGMVTYEAETPSSSSQDGGIAVSTSEGFTDPSELDIEVPDTPIRSASDLGVLINDPDGAEPVYAALSTLLTVTPPDMYPSTERLIDAIVKSIKADEDIDVPNEDLSEQAIKEGIATTPPIDLDIKIKRVIDNFENSNVSQSTISNWKQLDCPNSLRRFINGAKPVNGLNLSKKGKYVGMIQDETDVEVAEGRVSPVVYSYPSTESAVVDSMSPVRQTPLTDAETMDKYDLTSEQGALLTALAKAYNSALDGYSLVDPMADIASQYDSNLSTLIDKGLIDTRKLHQNRKYIELTDEGWRASGITRKWGKGKGDKYDGVIHRAGADLCKRYYEQNPDHHNYDSTLHVKQFVKSGNHRLDLKFEVGHRTVAVGEVESQGIQGNTDQKGVKNYESVREDAQIMANSPGDSIWIVQNVEIVAGILRALNSSENELGVNDDLIGNLETYDVSISELNKELNRLNDPRISRVHVYKDLWDGMSATND